MTLNSFGRKSPGGNVRGGMSGYRLCYDTSDYVIRYYNYKSLCYSFSFDLSSLHFSFSLFHIPFCFVVQCPGLYDVVVSASVLSSSDKSCSVLNISCPVLCPFLIYLVRSLALFFLTYSFLLCLVLPDLSLPLLSCTYLSYPPRPDLRCPLVPRPFS